jgi:hypothetical protein
MKLEDKHRLQFAYPLLQELLQSIVLEPFLPPKDAAKQNGYSL